MRDKGITKTIYCSVGEFEADFFPNLHEKKLKIRFKKKHEIFGAKFAVELLQSAAQDLRKTPS